MARAPVQVPAFVVSGLVCFLVSIGGTVVVMLTLGYKTETNYDVMADAMAKKNKGGGGGGGGGGGDLNPKAVLKAGGEKGAMAKGLDDPRPIVLLTTLITKLDAITAEPGKLQLSDDQCAKIAEQLTQLIATDILADLVARKHLDAILAVLEKERPTLEAAGVKWPGGTYNPNVPPVKNPFKEGEPARHVKSLQDRLTKPK